MASTAARTAAIQKHSDAAAQRSQLLRAKITVACVTGEHFKPTEIPEALRRKMQASIT